MLKQSHRIAELDGLRAFAVLGVVVFHVGLTSLGIPKISQTAVNVLSCLGLTGVNIFFVISGFIITTLLMREQRERGRVSLRAFYIRRFFRIIPPLAAYLAVLLALVLLGKIILPLHNLLWSLLFLGDTALLDSNAWVVLHTWSLSVEEQYYLFLPPLLCFVTGFRTRATAFVLGASYILSVAALKLAHELVIHVGPQWISIMCLYYFRHIIIGVFLAIYGGPIVRLLENTSRIIPLLLLPTVALLLHVPTPLFAALEPLLCGLFVMWFVKNPEKCKFLRWRAVQWLGACSYSIYLWQQLFINPAHPYSGWNLLALSLSLIAIVACAGASHRWIERPCIKAGRLISGATPTSHPAGTGPAATIRNGVAENQSG